MKVDKIKSKIYSSESSISEMEYQELFEFYLGLTILDDKLHVVIGIEIRKRQRQAQIKQRQAKKLTTQAQLYLRQAELKIQTNNKYQRQIEFNMLDSKNQEKLKIRIDKLELEMQRLNKRQSVCQSKNMQIKQPSLFQILANYFSAFSAISNWLVTIIAAIYTISQLYQIEDPIFKWIMIGMALTVTMLIIIFVCIYPRMDIIKYGQSIRLKKNNLPE